MGQCPGFPAPPPPWYGPPRPPSCVWFVTQWISRNHLAQALLYHSSTHDCVTKEPLQAAYRIIQQYNPPGTIHPPIIHSGILDSLRNRSSDLYYHKGTSSQLVVAERVFRRDPREDVIRWRRLHGSLFEHGQATRLYGGNSQFIDDRQAAAIVRRKSQLVQV